MIKVTTDPNRKLVRAVMQGLLTVEEVEQFGRDEQAAVTAMGLKSGEFDLLIESTTQQVQTQKAMEAFRRLIISSPYKARKIATVRAGALSQMQTRRVSQARSNAEVFGSVGEAMEWLYAQD